MTGSSPSTVSTGRGHSAAYQQLAEELRDLIRSAASEHQQLPTEKELSGRYQVSRQTVRRAYLELVADGVVERIPGKGTFPAPKGHYRRSFSSIVELLALSIDTELRIVEPLSATSNASAASCLGLQFDSVLHVGYQRLHQGKPFCYTDVYLPPRMEVFLSSASLLKRKSARSGITVLGLLDRVLPHPIAGAKQTVTAVAAALDIAGQIDCREGEPILRISRIHFDTEGRPIEQCINHYNPERYSYTLQLQRHGHGLAGDS
jgi:GntR family transcriptional regulator